MKNKLPYIIATAILVGVAMLAVYSQSVPTRVSPSNPPTRPGPPMPPTPSESLSLTMEIRKATVLLLEPIALEFTVAHKANESWSFQDGIMLSSPRVKLTIRKPNGETFTPKQLSYENARMFLGDSKSYKAGETIVRRATLEFRLEDYFGEIGEYQLQASYLNSDQALLTTNWVTLFVEYPQGEDALAYEELKNIKEPFDGVFTFGAKEKRLAFVQKFPNSRYANYSKFALAKDLSDEDVDRAMELFEALDAKPDFVFASDARQNLEQLRAEKEQAKRLEEHRAAKKMKGETPIQKPARPPVRVN